MKKCFFLLLIGSFTVASAQPIQVLPQPVQVQPGKGVFTLTKTTPITFEQPAAQLAATLLGQHLAKPTGYALPVRAATGAGMGSIHCRLVATPIATLGKEGYTLRVSSAGAEITANEPAGLYYGVQTLLQLLPTDVESQTLVRRTWTLPAVQITDYPRFGWRGIMFDVSRHFFSKAEVKRYIDEMARMKFNTFHWHLTDDEGWRIEIKSLPKLTSVGAFRVPRMGKFGQIAPPKPGEAATDGGFYTQDDIREVVQYAAARQVTIVPEIDVPGHSMAAIASYPELSCTQDKATFVNPGAKFSNWFPDGTFTMDIDNTLNPANEDVYVFLNKVFTEVAALFPGQYIHVGGDECYKGYWAKNPACQALMKAKGYQHVEQLQGYFMGRVEQILQAHGKKLLGWDEILEGGISPTAAVMSWRGLKGGIEASKTGHDVVMTPTTYCYIDYMQGDATLEPPIYSTLRLKTCYDFEPVPDSANVERILGGQANLWTEAVPTLYHAEYMTWPRAYALSEVYWSPKSSRNWAGFVPRLEAQFARADRAGVNYARSAYDAVVTPTLQNGKLMVTLDPQIPGLTTYYTFDDSVPGRYSPVYAQPVEIPDGPITLRVITYRNGQPIGRLLTLKRADLLARVKVK